MSEKVKLPRDVAEVIEKLRKHGFSSYAIVCMVHEGHEVEGISVLRDYAILHHDELLKALVNGYEVEETPEEKVRNHYLGFLNEGRGDFSEGVLHGIKFTLDAYSIKIEGVNA